MKRHHAAEAPPASGVREEIETDKMDKFAAKGRNRFYRVCLLVVVATTFLTLVRHFYCSGLSDSAVVIGPLSDPSSSLFNIRKLSPVARSNHSPPPPPPPADTGDKNPSSSGSLSDAGETTLSDSSTSASDAGDKPLSNPSGTSEASSTADEAALSNPSASASDVGDKPLSNSSGSSGETSPTADGKSLPNPSSSAADGEQHGGYSFARALAAADDKSDPCGGRYIYVQELPPRFNTDLVRDCATLFPWTDMCTYTANGGFGARLSNAEGVFQDTDWYDSDQYTLDISFHDRIKRYECLTNDSPLAAAVFVPFYAGLEVARHLWGYNVSTRDALALEMVGAVTARPEWRAMGGRDHFFVAGRTTWDFRRLTDADREWGSKLFRLPAVRNMTALVVEASPWHSNDAAVPFPTAFHPARDEDVFLWQERVRALERQWLFSFAGAPRPGDAKSIRNELIEQCKASTVCSLLQCGKGPTQCLPASFMKLFQSSTFCLQPRGDSATRKSAFDAMLAGCIPVFFHPATMYVQYFWHLPRDYTKYSVYISEEDVRSNVSIEERLRKIPADEVERMRATVIDLIPTVVYSDPSSKLETIKDAFDVTVKAVIDKVTKLRRDIVEGRQLEDGGPREMYSWKYPLLGKGQKVEEPHEWDPLFAFD